MKFNIFGLEIKITASRGLNSTAGWDKFVQEAKEASPYTSSELVTLVKHYRVIYGTGLREAKNAIDALRAKHEPWRRTLKK